VQPLIYIASLLLKQATYVSGQIKLKAKVVLLFLSCCAGLLWPHIAPAVEKQVWEMLPDMMNKAKPAWITTLGLRK
jgi:hypothetical protein